MSNKEATDGAVDLRTRGSTQSGFIMHDGQEVTDWRGWAASVFPKMRSVFLCGFLSENFKSLKFHLNNLFFCQVT